jgi:hypothetical protein
VCHVSVCELCPVCHVSVWHMCYVSVCNELFAIMSVCE